MGCGCVGCIDSAGYAQRAARASAANMSEPACRVRIATDCSGIDTPLYALRETWQYRERRFNISHEFSSDICKHARAFIQGNHRPRQLFTDIGDRDHYKLKKEPDLYIVGPPCQPWSRLGKKGGWSDPRSDVFQHVFDTIEAILPRCVIMEEVSNFIHHDGGSSWKRVKKEIRRIGYRIRYDILRASQFGLPQSRPRLYLVAYRADIGVAPCIPEPPEMPIRALGDFLEPDRGIRGATPGKKNSHANRNLRKALKRLKKAGINHRRRTIAIDIDSTRKFMTMYEQRSPTLTRSRPAGFWLTSRERRMLPAELFRSHGIDPSQVVPTTDSARVLGQLVGNTMTVPVVKFLLEAVLSQLFDEL